MPRRIDQIELVLLAIAANVSHSHGIELDRDAALALEIQRVENLRFHLALLQHAGGFDQAVGERRLPVIDVRDNTEVANVIEVQIGSRVFWRERRRESEI